MRMISIGNWRSSTQNMVMVELKGLHTVRAKGRVYYYAWRGGPAVKGEPGTPEFQDSYNEAIASRQAPSSTKFSASITRYRASDDYKNLAESTRRNWGPWLAGSPITSAICRRANSTARKLYSRRFGHGAPNMRPRRAPPITACRCCRASSRSRSTMASSHQTPARA